MTIRHCNSGDNVVVIAASTKSGGTDTGTADNDDGVRLSGHVTRRGSSDSNDSGDSNGHHSRTISRRRPPQPVPLLPVVLNEQQQHQRLRRSSQRMTMMMMIRRLLLLLPPERMIVVLIVIVVVVIITTTVIVPTMITTTTTTTNELLLQQPNESSKSPLHDPTLQWDDTKYPHVWLAYEQQQQQQQIGVHNNNNDNNNKSHIPPIPKPPYMILLTNYGWNQLNQPMGLSYARCYRSTEYIQSIINHPYFHPTAYTDFIMSTTTTTSSSIQRIIDPDVTYYVFLDVETCYESNYPHYGRSYYGNCDDGSSSSSSRTTTNRRHQWKRSKYTSLYLKYFHPASATCYNFHTCHYIPTELQQNPLFRTISSSSKNNNKLILLDCRGNGQDIHKFGRNDDLTMTMTNTSSSTAWFSRSPYLAISSLSSTKEQLQLLLDPSLANGRGSDSGLPPPAIVNITIPHQQYQHEMLHCHNDDDTTTSTTILPENNNDTNHPNHNNNDNNPILYRPYLLSFAGDYYRHPIRQALEKFDTIRNTLISGSRGTTTTTPPPPKILITTTKDLYERSNGLSYTELLLSSQFVAVPRGDNLYSYRFSEVLSSGAIPVLIHTDEWVLPFRPEIVTWDQCLVRISAEQVHHPTYMISILQSMSISEQCQRRHYCHWIYMTYMNNSTATIQGIIDGLQAISHHPTT